ncbi:EAL domain-containing protein [Idiomarina abyssalis]|uniref:Sensor protein FixL n=1 Tax=Idiomarina abyssalis TaxID=86102 RepID=A0A8I1G6E5_9GAMM|nr:bifunctional diguanylate cyclase/phosphodiesterase [Idiomarina abyssalis]MBJ7265670.1 EAL domain-containing protein [Idiomarina abyssalis]MBJ7273854.1 EAL domain-containing protein [Idiomarina abyssalis]MBJ7314440.1 EAL domain-containing protein [Idiomarina abyssalis]
MVSESPEQREKELLTSVETMANIGSFWYEPATEHLYWSRQLREIHGITDNEPINYEKAMAFHLPEYRENIKQLVAQSLEFNRSWSAESCLEDTAGHIHWVSITGVTKQVESGETVLFGAIQDVTEKKHRLQQLQEQTSALRSTLDNLIDAVITIDSKGIITNFSAPAERMFGYSEAEVKGNNVSMLMPEPYAREHDRYLEAYQETGRARIIGIGREVQGKRKNGEVFPIDLAVTEVSRAGEAQYIGVIRDITEQKENARKLEYLANFDEQTGLPNRHRFLDLVEKRLESNRAIVVAAVNMDYFNRVNTIHGHEEGDRVIQLIAQRLRETIGDSGWIARDLGDRFWVGVMRDSTQAGLEVIRKLHDALREPFRTKFQTHYLTASIGVGLSGGDENASELLSLADTATSNARHNGRDQIAVYEAEISESVVADAKTEVALRAALGKRQFECWLQSKVDTHGVIRGAEALMRWRNENGELVSPAQFIPVAERLQLIIPMARELLQQVAFTLNRLKTQGLDDNIAVNVSPVEFLQSDYVETVQQIFAEYDAPLSQLTMEITENLLLADAEKVQQTMSRLAELGVVFSIDDFGTGYSNLLRIQQLPITELKIDREFVQLAEVNEKHMGLLMAMLNMARSLSVSSVAEGVETAEQVKLLGENGADLLQGFYFARPVHYKTWLDERLPQ